MGEAPDWYHRLRIARFLGVAPWDLNSVPMAWQAFASMAEEAEANATKNSRQWQQFQADARAAGAKK